MVSSSSLSRSITISNRIGRIVLFSSRSLFFRVGTFCFRVGAYNWGIGAIVFYDVGIVVLVGKPSLAL